MTKKLYEAMFLIDSAQAGSDWDGTLAAVKRVLERADAEVVYLEKWADRRLAFEIARKTRGTYILCYFRAEGSKIAGIEKDVTLSEQIMRVLILTAEDRPGDSVKRDLAGETKAPQELYSRDDRRSGPRKRDDARHDKKRGQGAASAEPAEAKALHDTAKEEEAGTSDDAKSAPEASADTGAAADGAVASDAETPADKVAGGDDAVSDTAPKTEPKTEPEAG